MKTVFSTNPTDPAKATDVEGVGSMRYDNDGRIYRWVKNGETTITLNQGAICTHKYADGNNLFNNVYQPLTANFNLAAGAACVTIGPGQYGWVQCWGPSATVLVFQSHTTPNTQGQIHGLVNAQSYLSDTVLVAAGTAPTYNRNFTALETIATVTPGAAALKKFLINCL